MKTVKRKRSKDLGRLIVSKTDLKNFWNVLERHAVTDAQITEFERKANPNRYFPDDSRPKISISSAGGITTDADDGAVLDNDVLDTLKTESVSLSYNTYYPKNKSITIHFKERYSYFDTGGGYLSVNGDDVAWVDATFAELERIASAVKPQSKWFEDWRTSIVAVFAILIGFIFAQAMTLLSGPDNSPEPHWIAFAKAHPPLMWLLAVGLFFCFGYFPAAGLANWIGQLWPTMEFDFGPEHLKAPKEKRARIGAVAVLVVIPLLLEVLKRYGFDWR